MDKHWGSIGQNVRLWPELEKREPHRVPESYVVRVLSCGTVRIL